MRRTATIIAGVTALSGLLAITGLGTAAYGGAVPPANTAPLLKPGGCDKDPERAPKIAQVPVAQKMFGAERVWPISTGRDVTIAVLDSGVDVSHPQLNGGNISAGANFLGGSGDGRQDCDGHGTAVTSLIAAKKVSGVGFQGLAYGAKILPVTVTAQHDDENNASRTAGPDKVAKAIDWAVDHGAKVINMSFTMKDNTAVKRAISNAISHDVVVVAAVGNGAKPAKDGAPADPGPTPYPAAYDGVIGVGAIDMSTKPTDSSQWNESGTLVDLVGPGEQVQAANWGKYHGHSAWDGTSFAAPFVSAAAALVRSKWPDLSADEVAQRLFATASPAAGPKYKVGHGLVDPYRALTEGMSAESPAALPGASPPSPDPETVARTEEWRLSGNVALAVAGIGVVLAGVMLSTLTLLPLGIRRRWRPGRAKPFPEPVVEDTPPAPLKLFEDLEAK